MKREVELSILDELLRQLDEKKNVDAGVMYRNPTSAYTCTEVARREQEVFFRDHPQLIGLSGSLQRAGLVHDRRGLRRSCARHPRRRRPISCLRECLPTSRRARR